MSSATEFVPVEDEHPSNEPSSSVMLPSAQPEGSSSHTAGHDRPPEASAKRLACNPCRDRKVRCDRQHPTCGRCTKLGNNCVYSSPSKQTVSKVDLSRLLLTLHNRLELAEAQLAFQTPTPNANPVAYPWPDMGPAPAPESAPLRPALQDPQTSRGGIPSATMAEVASEWYNNHERHDLFDSTISTDFSGTQSLNDTFDVDPVFQELSPSPYSDIGSQASSTVPITLFPRLHASFFDVFYPTLPFINRVRFQAELAQSPDSTPLQALSHAIGALGALGSTELASALEPCYNQARTLLELCERQENGVTLIDINTLQTYVLLSVYEFKQPNLARAWITLGRAVRLAKIMCLDKDTIPVDSDLFIPHLPPCLDPAQAEERRRTFWQIYILDTYAGMKTKSSPTLNSQTSVSLPCSAELHKVNEANGMPGLHQVFDIVKGVPLSSFAGAAVVVYLYRRCSDHFQACIQQPSYPFWDTHYAIDKAITHCRKSLLTHHLSKSNQGAQDVLAIILRMNLAGLEIKLHETAITKAEKDKLPAALTTEAIVRCQSAAMDIVDSIRVGQRLTSRNLEIFRHSNLFYAKTMAKAIQAYMWMLNNLKNNTPTHINALRLLTSSTKELIDAKHLRSALLDQVDAKVAEAERPKKRPFLPSQNSF